MRLVDTSAWVEWLIGSSIGETVAAHLPRQSAWLVPTMVQLELVKWLTRERGEDMADQVIAFTQVCSIVPSTRRSHSPPRIAAAGTALQPPTRSSLPRPAPKTPTC